MALTLVQLELRKNSIGGSDAAVAVGISPYRTPLELYLEKTGLKQPEDISDVDAVYWGSRLEDIIAEEYARRTGNTIELDTNTLYHPKYNFMSAHLDRRITNLNRLLECKTANAYLEREWGNIDTDEVPLHYIVQTQHYLSVTGLEAADLAVLIGGQDYRIYTIPRDNDLIIDLERAEGVFWQRIKNLNPPDPINNDDLKLLYGYDNGTVIETTNVVHEAWESLKQVKKQIKTLDAEQTELEFIVKKFMAEHTTLSHHNHGKPMATWKTQDNNRFQTSVFSNEHPELYQQYVINSPTRVLRLKK